MSRMTDGEPISGPYIYFISEGSQGPIKIGRASDPAQRLCTMQIGNSRPLRVIGLIKGASEREWHNRYAGQRISGEWFRRSPGLMAAIKEGRTHVLAKHVRDGRTRRADRIQPAPTNPSISKFDEAGQPRRAK